MTNAIRVARVEACWVHDLNEALGTLQRAQHSHDMRNHFDIMSLGLHGRLKHYGLHFAKYVGRLARGQNDPNPVEKTLADTLLICLSSANALSINLGEVSFRVSSVATNEQLFIRFADAVGVYADACEKIDHIEEFLPQIKWASIRLTEWTIEAASFYGVDPVAEVLVRRQVLAAKRFYIED